MLINYMSLGPRVLCTGRRGYGTRADADRAQCLGPRSVGRFEGFPREHCSVDLFQFLNPQTIAGFILPAQRKQLQEREHVGEDMSSGLLQERFCE